MHELAAQFGQHRSTTGQHLRARGIDTTRRALTPDDVQVAARLYHSGYSILQLADKFKVGNETMRQHLLNAGVALRPKGRPARSLR
ncbi:hypothetical protein [Saccharothrix deserti]|uniref:hypothetical protein n=1 Tax=Saccharothrix deserti TaxID=2593674 RepID=UPI00131D88C2|nr:hypothetical protein [Saccharothrix deserti]